MGYTNCLMISQMKELDLFDDIKYKYIKNFIKHDDDDIKVEIEDLECDRVAWCKTRFKFEIDLGSGNGILKIDLEKEYNSSSPYALMMMDLYEEEEEEEEEEPLCQKCKKWDCGAGASGGLCVYSTHEEIKKWEDED